MSSRHYCSVAIGKQLQKRVIALKHPKYNARAIKKITHADTGADRTGSDWLNRTIVKPNQSAINEFI